MGRILVLLIAVSFLITGCASVDVYTFKKDRVDQTIKGNRGYLTGKASESQGKAVSSQRTMIGVDVEFSGPAAQGKKDGTRFKKGGAIPGRPEKVKASDANIPQPKKKTPKPVVEKKKVSAKKVGSKKVEKKKPATIVVETVVVETEEEWIK